MRAAAAAGSSTRALAAAEGVRQRHWARGVRWLGAQMGRGWPGIRRGTRLCQSSQSVHKQRPTVSESQELCGCGVPLWVVPDSQECHSACAGSGKNSVTGLIVCHFTTRMWRRGRPRVCTNLFNFFGISARPGPPLPARPGRGRLMLPAAPTSYSSTQGRGAVGGSLCQACLRRRRGQG